MKKALLALAATLAMCASALAQTVQFSDGFDPSINSSIWLLGPWRDLQNPDPWGGHHLEGANNHIRSPGNAAMTPRNYRVAYNAVHPLVPQLENVYLRGWIFEDNEASEYPMYNPPEQTPNAFITIANTDAVQYGVSNEDWYRIGVKGHVSNILWSMNLAVETRRDGSVLLAGWPRRQGWRKYAIEVFPFTGNYGDVKFYVDDTLVYNGRRITDSYVDRIIVGTYYWTYTYYWYDDIEFGVISTPTACPTLAAAKEKADGQWVSVTGQVVTGRFTKSPFAGWAAIEETDRSSGLWVSTSKELSLGDRVTIRGRMATSPAGFRYLDAAEISAVSGPELEPLGMNGRAFAARPNTDGLVIRLWGKIIGRGQEQTGDWRRYLLLSVPGLSDPVRVYWDLISNGDPQNPVPVPNPVDNRSMVSVRGVAGREVIGGQIWNTLWIRKAGDLVIHE